jgi:hypothetical protein
VPNGASISLPFLLPPYAQVRLYTYPECWQDATSTQQDCLYAALNFFNEAPEPALLDREYADRILHEEYVQVHGEAPAYGDIIMFPEPSGRPRHACVYIVADFVFTKNGLDSSQPWVFMRLSDVSRVYYGTEAPPLVSILRHKAAASHIEKGDNAKRSDAAPR